MRIVQRSIIDLFLFMIVKLHAFDLIMPRAPPPCFLKKQLGRHITYELLGRHKRLLTCRTYEHTLGRVPFFLFSYMHTVCTKEEAQHGTAAPQKQ